jgi:hypothetical protein
MRVKRSAKTKSPPNENRPSTSSGQAGGWGTVTMSCYFAASLAHLARPFRKGSAPAGELTVVRVVSNG